MDRVPDLTSPDLNAAGLGAPVGGLRYDWNATFGPQDVGEAPAIIRGWVPEGARVLDVGCGTGSHTLKYIEGKTCRFLGVEPDADRAALARSRGLDVVTGLMDEHLLETRGPFDLIIFSDVLEHVAAPASLLELAKTGLAPGGVIVASVPNVAHWTVRLMLLFGRFDYRPSGIMDATHLRWFTHKTVRGLFEYSGMRVMEISPSAGAWMRPYHIWPLRFMPRALRVKLVRGLARAAPRLFGYQMVVRAALP
jgi:methionine biosynthesis protein MetW